FSVSIEQLVPFRTVTGRQSFYLDHEMMFEWGEAMSVYKPILDFKPLKNPLGQTKEITLKFLTPHNKWSTHSMYFDSQQMLTLFRGGQTVWLNEKDAAEIDVCDNDWCEVYNRNGVVISRAVVSPRLPRGVMFMYHAQDRHINVPASKISGTRGGTHNTPTRIHMKPTHMIGGYGQLSYGFNYYGTTGNQRDIYVVVRKAQEVDWLED
ncbi:MAG: nitrate reductase subunit alpha, partial [Selenomonadaceae bacterium]|nr:nitrate reductase subunit alpha [Selenomonadaceae bacterium]